MNKKTLLTLIIVLGVIVLILIISKSPAPNTTQNLPENTVSSENTNNTSPASTTSTTTPIVSTGTSFTLGTVVTAKLGQTVTLSSVTGTLTQLVEDSRCPAGVQCIQAGTVKVKVHFAYGSLGQDTTLTLNQTFSMSGHSITLISVKPDKKEGVTIAPSDYVFTFNIK